MIVLSLFDGISCARVAFEKAKIPLTKYYASEIDKKAIQVALSNYPNTIELGDVCSITKDTIEEPIDLIIGGSPCTNLSCAGNGKGLEGDESKLFWEFVRLVEELKPKHFVLENVASMTDENRDIISNVLKCNPVMIDAGRVSAQTRRRYFWANFKITQPPENSKILKDILGARELAEDITDKVLNKTPGTLAYKNAYRFIRTPEQKCRTLMASGQGVSNTGATNIKVGDRIYRLTPEECETLMGLPQGYTKGIALTARYFAIGNAFHVDVVHHILRCMSEGKPNNWDNQVRLF